IEDFDYHLPPELVAQYPRAQRDASRLLVVRRQEGEIHHAGFRDLARWLDPRDLLVVNDTRVFPARLQGRKESGGRVELLLHHLPVAEAEGNDFGGGGEGQEAPPSSPKPPPPTPYRGLGREFEGRVGELISPSPPLKNPSTARARATYRGRLQVGQILKLGDFLKAEIVSLVAPGVAEVRFCSADGDVGAAVFRMGQVPLPPYIRRAPEGLDQERYQTVYAARAGAMACPTAGLHFTPEALRDLARRGIDTAALTLHVGPGTFMPVRHPDYTRHRMHPEYFELSEPTAARLNQARDQGRRFTAVGTTSVRVLEYCAGPAGFLPQQGWCDLFIYPGYRFKAVDRLLTNFHLPRSTLLLLVSAFAGRDLILRAYEEAVKEKYRFYSYGDAMLIL
ncbi:MAG TPA: tRNA preQ1(34) S-adenosylmethionine ribosyltransferase-isomerase QueA, partial [Desulfobaccales bacterium]